MTNTLGIVHRVLYDGLTVVFPCVEHGAISHTRHHTPIPVKDGGVDCCGPRGAISRGKTEKFRQLNVKKAKTTLTD